MSYLILDTETNGVNPITDKVIEIGGLIAEYDQALKKLVYVDSYQSLIYLETGLDTRITDLTGITVDELNEGPKRPKVQAEWSAFVAKYKISHILGHSLDFDTRFLKSNGFELPDAKEIDTLDITKILSPDAKAVNLNFLNKTYELDQYFPKPQVLLNLQHHRALYDAFMCASLFNYLIDKLSKSNSSTDFLFAYDYYINERLGLIAHEEESNVVALTLSNEVNCLKQNIDENTQYIFSKIVEDENCFVTLNSLFITQKDSKNTMYPKVILSIWFGLLNINRLGKVIINGGQEKKFYDLIIASLSAKSEIIESGYDLKFPEEFILESKELTTKQLSVRDMLDYLDLYSDLKSNIDNEKGLLRLNFQKILTALRNLNKTSYYNIDRANSTLEQGELTSCLEDFKSYVEELEKTIVNHYSNTALEVEILKKIKLAKEVLAQNTLSFFYFDSDVRFIVNADYDLTSYLDGLLMHANSIETSLTAQEYLEFINLFSLKGSDKIKYGPTVVEVMDNDLLEELREVDDKVKLVFIGKSANLKTLPQKLANAEIKYIDVSNTGSATKILSAIEHGFKGVAVLNYKNLDFVANFLGNFKDSIEFYYYGDTFLALTKSIKDLNHKGINQFEFDKAVSKLYLKFLLNKVYLKFDKKIKFYKEI
jgi:DNA polymerase III epsilon subunit-like protein